MRFLLAALVGVSHAQRSAPPTEVKASVDARASLHASCPEVSTRCGVPSGPVAPADKLSSSLDCMLKVDLSTIPRGACYDTMKAFLANHLVPVSDTGATRQTPYLQVSPNMMSAVNVRALPNSLWTRDPSMMRGPPMMPSAIMSFRQPHDFSSKFDGGKSSWFQDRERDFMPWNREGKDEDKRFESWGRDSKDDKPGNRESKDSKFPKPWDREDKDDKRSMSWDRENKDSKHFKPSWDSKDSKHSRPWDREDQDDKHSKPWDRDSKDSKPSKPWDRDSKHSKPWDREDKDDKHSKPWDREDKDDKRSRPSKSWDREDKDSKHSKPSKPWDREDKDDKRSKPWDRDSKDNKHSKSWDRDSKFWDREDREDKDSKHSKPWDREDKDDKRSKPSKPWDREDKDSKHSKPWDREDKDDKHSKPWDREDEPQFPFSRWHQYSKSQRFGDRKPSHPQFSFSRWHQRPAPFMWQTGPSFSGARTANSPRPSNFPTRIPAFGFPTAQRSPTMLNVWSSLVNRVGRPAPYQFRPSPMPEKSLPAAPSFSPAAIVQTILAARARNAESSSPNVEIAFKGPALVATPEIAPPTTSPSSPSEKQVKVSDQISYRSAP